MMSPSELFKEQMIDCAINKDSEGLQFQIDGYLTANPPENQGYHFMRRWFDIIDIVNKLHEEKQTDAIEFLVDHFITHKLPLNHLFLIITRTKMPQLIDKLIAAGVTEEDLKTTIAHSKISHSDYFKEQMFKCAINKDSEALQFQIDEYLIGMPHEQDYYFTHRKNAINDIVDKLNNHKKNDAIEFLVEDFIIHHTLNLDLLNILVGAVAKINKPLLVDQLITAGADITTAAKGAVRGGHYAYAKTFIEKGVNQQELEETFAHIMTYMKDDKDSHFLQFLSLFSVPMHVPETNNNNSFSRGYDDDALDAFDLSRMSISQAVRDRTKKIQTYMENGGSYALGLTITDKETQKHFISLVLFFMSTQEKDCNYTMFPVDVWLNILTFIAPMPVKREEMHPLFFTMERSLLGAQLSTYQNSYLCNHYDRAASFEIAVKKTKDTDELQTLVTNQVKVLQGKNPYPKNEQKAKHQENINNTTPNRYHEVIGLWSKVLAREEVTFESQSVLSNIKSFFGVSIF